MTNISTSRKASSNCTVVHREQSDLPSFSSRSLMILSMVLIQKGKPLCVYIMHKLSELPNIDDPDGDAEIGSFVK